MGVARLPDAKRPAAMAARSGKEPLDPVRLNQLLSERVRKELQYQRLYTQFSVNPLHRGKAARRRPRNHTEPAGSTTPRG